MSPPPLLARGARVVRTRASAVAARPAVVRSTRAVHTFGPTRSMAVAGGALGAATLTPAVSNQVNAHHTGGGELVSGGAIGAAAGNAAFLHHGYAIRREGRALERQRPEGMSRSAHQKLMSTHHRLSGVPNGTRPDRAHALRFYRSYPVGLPASSAKHRLARLSGKRGAAVNALAIAGGATLGAGSIYGGSTMIAHANGRGHRQEVGKALYARERRPSAVRVLETSAGLGLAAWGLGRSPMLGRALARGVKQAGRSGNANALSALQLAQASQGVLRRGTMPAERHIRQIQRLDQAINRVPASARPEIAAAAGILLTGHAHPVFRDNYRPVGMTGRVRGPGW